MSLFNLDSQQHTYRLAENISASLRLCDLGPPSICFPLLAATYRAVLGNSDFSIHLVGPTGTYKTELAALFQRHFGQEMDRLHLPGSWSSTPNSLESLAFQAKDTLLVIDDFAPQGSATDVQRYHAAADRVFRAVGNHAGRGRMDSTTRLREPKPPRCLVLSTGEEIPRGQSIRARLLILELAKGTVSLEALTACQKDASDGCYVVAMYGFVRWTAQQYERIQEVFTQRVAELRAKSLQSAAHARTPVIIANLQAGFEVFLWYAHECGALKDAEVHSLSNRCWEDLGMAAADQGKHQIATEPVARYLTLLRSLLSSGRAHLASRKGGPPDHNPESCGWRCNASKNWEPMGDCIGWVNGEDLYLEPTATYRLIQIAGRDRGEALEISEQTMNKRLSEKKLLLTVEKARGTLTIRKTICGISKDVLHLSKCTILPKEDGDNES